MFGAEEESVGDRERAAEEWNDDSFGVFFGFGDRFLGMCGRLPFSSDLHGAHETTTNLEVIRHVDPRVNIASWTAASARQQET